MRYQIYFKDHGGNTFSVDGLEAETDRKAIALARHQFRSGIGGSYEIWKSDVHVHTEIIGGHAASSGGKQRTGRNGLLAAQLRKCIRKALTADTLERQCDHLRDARECARKLVELGGQGQTYCLKLKDGDGAVTDVPIVARYDAEALESAAAIAESVAATCVRYDLWRGSDCVGSAGAPFRRLDARELNDRAQLIVLEREIALHESRRSIAESQALLKKIEGWVAVAAL